MSSVSCEICLERMKEPRQLQCGHRFCGHCVDMSISCGHYLCPTCRKPFRPAEGTQPASGTMQVSRSSSALPGHEGCGTITISYCIPSGTQTEAHPNPGRLYSGTSRTAYLPDNRDGNEVLQLLRRAFDARITFTVGRSATTGIENTVTWNDIHHKTNTSGGTSGFGYPDPTYLHRVRQELASMGIV